MLIRETSQVGLFVVGIIIGILLSLTILSRRDVIDTKIVDSVFHGDVTDTIVDMVNYFYYYLLYYYYSIYRSQSK